MASADAVTDQALKLPLFRRLSGLRVVLASSSPRRSEILATIGLKPEIVPSTFAETLPHGQFADDLGQYAVATATEKAVEVYTRLVEQSPEAPPDVVIGADTIIICDDQILEKPGSRAENLRMLLDLNGRAHDVVTAVTVVWPIVAHPGYATASLCETTHVHFAEHERAVLEAYADCGEGVDRAGGYAIQGRGALLVQRIEGGASASIGSAHHADYNCVVGFPASAFVRWLSDLLDNDEFLEDV